MRLLDNIARAYNGNVVGLMECYTLPNRKEMIIMSKKNIDMVAITPQKANAQHLTCFTTFIVTTAAAIFLMLFACVFPAIVPVTEIICWISMFFEAVSIGLGCLAFWIYRNAL